MGEVLNGNRSPGSPDDNSYGSSTESSGYVENSLHRSPRGNVHPGLDAQRLYLRLTGRRNLCGGRRNDYTQRYGFGTFWASIGSRSTCRCEIAGYGGGCGCVAESAPGGTIATTNSAGDIESGNEDVEYDSAGRSDNGTGEASDGGCGPRRKALWRGHVASVCTVVRSLMAGVYRSLFRDLCTLCIERSLETAREPA